MNKKLVVTVLLLMATTVLIGQEKMEVPDFSTTPRSEVPEEFKWKISDLFENKEDWENEKDRIAAMMDKLDEYRDGWTSSADKMLAFYTYLEEIYLPATKLLAYSRHNSNMDLQNAEYRKMTGQLQFILNQFQSRLSFINEDLLKLGEEKFAEYLKAEPKLDTYAFDIKDLFRRKEHILPADQQRIVSLTGMFAGAPSQASGALNNVDIPNPKVTLSDGKEYTLNYPTFARLRAAKNPEDRQKVMDAFFGNISKYENTFAILLDSAMKQHLFSATVTNYENTLKARMDQNNIDTDVYHKTIKNVKANLGSLHRLLKIKKELLGLETFRYVDMYANSVKSIDRVYTWDTARELIVNAMNPMGEKYLSPLNKAFDERWIDRYPNKGKQSGAYSSGVYGVHPFIKMNFTGDFNNVSTLAHELGHAMHSWFSNKTQPFNLASYSTFLAEMASTFNEHMLVDYIIENETDDMLKLYILDEYLTGMRSTIFRQVLFAEFELLIHQHVESGQTLTADWLNETYLRLTREYYGHDQGICIVDDYIKNEWSVVPHFYYNYYVINYTTGMISSLALTDMVKENGTEGVDRYIDFLSAGGSDYSLNILKRAGVDMTSDAPYNAAFTRMNTLLDEMESIVKRLQKDNKLAE